MKLAFLAVITLPAISSPLWATHTLAENCHGTETLQFAQQAPKTTSYSLTFSADLGAMCYCYDKCGRDQTYPIAKVTPRLINLSDENHVGQKRLMTFDRNSAVLTDDQEYNGGLGKIVRHAKATCQAAPFHEPATLARPHSR